MASARPFAAFTQFALPPGAPTFAELAEDVTFEHVGRGRAVAVLFRELGDSRVPIVRTTAKYNCPSRPFTRRVQALADAVVAAGGLRTPLNNAMAEIYDCDYRTMGFHSDMALDLDAASHIAIYSVYDSPAGQPPPAAVRSLVIVDKATGADRMLLLAPNTVTIFSVQDNSRFLHKIVLRAPPSPAADGVRWLGVTLRTSQTIVQFDSEVEGPPTFVSDGAAAAGGAPPRQLLSVASQTQAKELYALRQEENREVEFAYPPGLWHTLSPSDVLSPWSVT